MAKVSYVWGRRSLDILIRSITNKSWKGSKIYEWIILSSKMFRTSFVHWPVLFNCHNFRSYYYLQIIITKQTAEVLHLSKYILFWYIDRSQLFHLHFMVNCSIIGPLYNIFMNKISFKDRTYIIWHSKLLGILGHFRPKAWVGNIGWLERRPYLIATWRIGTANPLEYLR